MPTLEKTESSTADAAHSSFTAASPIGLVFVAYYNRRVSGLMIVKDGNHVRKHRDFIDYMQREVGVTVISDPDPALDWHTQIRRALDEGSCNVPVDLSSCSAFRQQVLRATTGIQRGEVRTYAEMAAAIGSPKAARAVGTALARNPIPLLVPCHRVVPSVGGVGKYAYGSELKLRLLASEGVSL